MMVSYGGSIADEKDWVKEHIESRERLGKEWRCRLEDHKKLAMKSRYIRIKGRKFRPVSIGGVNPCGHLRDERDQEILECDSLEEAIAKADSATEQKPGANKPEHRLQAFLILAALQNPVQFGRFHRVLPDFSDEFDELIFITDEFSMKNGKVRADIVALGGKGGRFFPVFIELKNYRGFDKLRDQLNNACEWLWKNDQARDPFRRFLSAVSGVALEKIDQEDKSARKMLIWPKSPSGKEAKKVDDARECGFLIVGFETLDFEPTYLFSRKTS